MVKKDIAHSLLIVIVNRGKASRILAYAHEQGAREASAFLGKGTVRSRALHLLEMDEVDKEILLLILPADLEDRILADLKEKFHLDRRNQGIAFTSPLAGLMSLKWDTELRWKETVQPANAEERYVCLLVTAVKGKADDIVRLSQEAGYFGGTVIRAWGAENVFSPMLGGHVGRLKDSVLMVMKRKDADRLSLLLNEKLGIEASAEESLSLIAVSKTVGLYGETPQKEEAR